MLKKGKREDLVGEEDWQGKNKPFANQNNKRKKSEHGEKERRRNKLQKVKTWTSPISVSVDNCELQPWKSGLTSLTNSLD